MNQKPIFNLEDTDLGMYCIVALALMFVVGVIAAAKLNIPDFVQLAAVFTTAMGLVSTIAVAKLKVKQAKTETPEGPTVIAPKKPSPARKRPMPTPKGSGVGAA